MCNATDTLLYDSFIIAVNNNRFGACVVYMSWIIHCSTEMDWVHKLMDWIG